MAHERVARDGEQERRERRVLAQPRRGLRELEPGLLGEVLGGVAPSAQAEQEREDARVVCRIHAIERGGVAAAEPVDELAVGRGFGPGAVTPTRTPDRARCDKEKETKKACHERAGSGVHEGMWTLIRNGGVIPMMFILVFGLSGSGRRSTSRFAGRGSSLGFIKSMMQAVLFATLAATAADLGATLYAANHAWEQPATASRSRPRT